MKKSTLTALLLLAGLSGGAQAANLECRLQTPQNNNWAQHCFGMRFTMDNKPANVSIRIQNLATTVSQVIWQLPAGQSCSATSTTCTIQIWPYSQHDIGATVLYSNGTYEIVSGTAWFETGF